MLNKLAIITSIFIALSASAAPVELTNTAGTVLSVEIDSFEDGKVRITRVSDSHEFTIPLSMLDESSQVVVTEWGKKKATLLGDAYEMNPFPPPATESSISGSKRRLIEYDDIDELAKELRRGTGLPGLGLCIISDYKIDGIGCDGRGGFNQSSDLNKSDAVVIASCSKSMTATLAAILVSKGHLTWTTTLVEVFPELSSNMNKRFGRATLEQLLSHSGGAPERDAFWRSNEYKMATDFDGEAREQRYELVRIVSERPPEFTPGKEHVYSNAGFYIAAAMFERVMDRSWESMMQELIFSPLGLQNTSATSDVDPPLTMPAGGISTTLEDYAKFCLFHLKYSADNILGIKRRDYEKLHETNDGSGYGLGFFVFSRPGRAKFCL